MGEDIRGKIIELAGLIDYQAGSVVSRTIIDKTQTTVTVFAFDKGQGLSEHTAPFDALVQIIDGQAEITISGEIFKVRNYESIIMPADKPHSLKAVEKFKMLLTMVKTRP